MWIYENIPDHFTDPHDLAQAMDALSTADLYRGRIRAAHDWSFTRYVIDYMTAGVAMARQYSKTSGWIPFKNNVEMAAGLAKWLDLDREMITYIVGSDEKAEAIMKLLS